jgi:hypothetical protein
MQLLRDERDIFRLSVLCRLLYAPQGLRHCRFGQRLLACELQDKLVQNVQIMSFSKQVLSFLEFGAPWFALFGQKTLHHVTEALHADAQFVPYLRAGLFHPTLMKVDDPS